MEISDQFHSPALYFRDRSHTREDFGWPTVGMDVVAKRKISPPAAKEILVVQPLDSHYTD